MSAKAILVLSTMFGAIALGLGSNSQVAGTQRAERGAKSRTAPEQSSQIGVFDFGDGSGARRGGVSFAGYFSLGLTFAGGNLTHPYGENAPVEVALRAVLLPEIVEAYISEHAETFAGIAKESIGGSVETVSVNPKKWTATKPTQVLLSIRVDENRAVPGDLEIPTGMSYLRLNVTMGRLSAPNVVNNIASGELRKFARLLAEKLAQELPDFSREYLKKRLADGVTDFESRLKLAEANRDTAQKMLTDSAGLPPERAAEQLGEVSRQQIGARLALVGMEAREKAIVEEIKRTEAKMSDKASGDETIGGLEKLLALRMQQLDRLRALRSKNAIAEQEVQPAEAGVLSAKIDLDKAKAALKRTSGGDRLDALNDELSRLTIDRAEAKARFNYLEEASKKFAEELRNRQEAEHRIEAAKPKLEEANKQIRRLSGELATIKAAQEKIEPIRVILPSDDAEPAEKAKQ